MGRPLRTPAPVCIDSIVVAAGFDVADDKIVELLNSGDLVITADIPLAAAAIRKQGHALNPRCELFTPDNVHEKLAVRNMLGELRGCGIETGGPAPLSKSDRQAFASNLEYFLAQH